MTENRAILYTPTWVRITAIILLVVGVALGAVAASHFLTRSDGNSADYIIASISLAHISLSGLVVAIVLFYSEREVSSRALRARTRSFLKDFLPSAFSNCELGIPGQKHWNTQMQSAYIRPIGPTGALYLFGSGHLKLHCYVSMNIRRLIVYYFFPKRSFPSVQDFCTRVGSCFEVGSKHVGYHISYFEGQDPTIGNDSICVACQVTADKNILLDSAELVFWANDIAEMTRAALLGWLCCEPPAPTNETA